MNKLINMGFFILLFFSFVTLIGLATSALFSSWRRER